MTTPLFLDTHIVIWIAACEEKNLSRPAKPKISKSDLVYSPMVRLELEYMHESGKIRHAMETVLQRLHQCMAIEESSTAFRNVCAAACAIGWTRETFDRLIVADAAFNKAQLVTADEKILQHYPLAVW